MKRLQCACGSQVFFESRECVNCGARLGIDPTTLSIQSLQPQGDGLFLGASGVQYRFCENATQWDVCNWLCPADDPHPLCFGCQFNRTIPNLSLPGNIQRWWILEQGKKRLFYTLLSLSLPLVDGWRDPRNGLLLDFIEDGRSHEDFAETFASTGFLGGVITINTLEADEVARVAAREQMNESYRTVLGHLRHESGHYYWSRLWRDNDLRADFSTLFGDETMDYAGALARHYREGPSPEWRNYYISAYASAHPAEDWAETWGHYLHIEDALETAAAYGVTTLDIDSLDINDRIALWRDLSITLNELNRSVGRGDAYPFVINSFVESKLCFVERAIRRLQTMR
ncbi:putative zinc-binding metallopeptidase [Haliea sp. E1-2-M8]|uniref:zinc-binding metallopeptidase family protein n=1 Tax=Haliea sp. E1-2-M8 TaxID=3064706 RepID=UPI0027205021|nr:putative zinc-binding metallopeptidase [Haliea sp. E1-2-M8]MDO8862693.1 putative zinc-binding metallopeptidase [Haliea sp. E1-2-M8]